MGDIEEAAGLTPRAGGLYRHFKTKRGVLEAAIERYVEHTQTVFDVVELMPTGDVRAEIVLLSRWALRELRAKRQLTRVLLRDGDEVPDLRDKYRDQVIRPGYDTIAEWIKRHVKQHGLPELDYEALATVTVGALVHYSTEEEIYGAPPAEVDDERFVQALADLCYGYFQNLRGSG